MPPILFDGGVRLLVELFEWCRPIIETSRSNGIIFSAIIEWGACSVPEAIKSAISDQIVSISSSDFKRHWPLPSYPAWQVFITNGLPNVLTACSRCAFSVISWYGAQATSVLSNKAFSSERSPPVFIACLPGKNLLLLQQSVNTSSQSVSLKNYANVT